MAAKKVVAAGKTETLQDSAGTSEAIILVNPVIETGKTRESIQFAAVTPEGEWLRLYADMFEDRGEIRKLRRWNKIRFEWQPSSEDARPESRWIDHRSIKILGELPQEERNDFLTRLEVKSLKPLSEIGRSLALLRPLEAHFMIERKTAEEMIQENGLLEVTAARRKNALPEKPCPYKFRYRYVIPEGERVETYRGTEINATFAKLVGSLGEAASLAWIIKVFGREHLEKGVAFAMGTSLQQPTAWKIKGIIGMNEISQTTGGRYNLVC